MAKLPEKPLRTHHAALKTADFEASLCFYTEGLGMKLLKTWGEGDSRAAMIDIGDGSCIEMFAGGVRGESVQEQAGCFVHLALEVDSPDEWYARALSCGAKEKSAPADLLVETSAEPLDVRIAFVYGPDGEVLEFFHSKRQSC